MAGVCGPWGKRHPRIGKSAAARSDGFQPSSFADQRSALHLIGRAVGPREGWKPSLLASRPLALCGCQRRQGAMASSRRASQISGAPSISLGGPLARGTAGSHPSLRHVRLRCAAVSGGKERWLPAVEPRRSAERPPSHWAGRWPAGGLEAIPPCITSACAVRLSAAAEPAERVTLQFRFGGPLLVSVPASDPSRNPVRGRCGARRCATR